METGRLQWFFKRTPLCSAALFSGIHSEYLSAWQAPQALQAPDSKTRMPARQRRDARNKHTKKMHWKDIAGDAGPSPQEKLEIFSSTPCLPGTSWTVQAAGKMVASFIPFCGLFTILLDLVVSWQSLFVVKHNHTVSSSTMVWDSFWAMPNTRRKKKSSEFAHSCPENKILTDLRREGTNASPLYSTQRSFFQLPREYSRAACEPGQGRELVFGEVL